MIYILLSECGDYALAQYLHIIRRALNIIQIVGPIVTIAILAVNLSMSMINSDDNKNNMKKITNSLIATSLLFFVPIIVNLAMNMLSNVGISNVVNFSTCWEEADRIYDMDFDSSIFVNNEVYNQKYSINDDAKNVINKIRYKSTSSKGTKDDIINGKKYNLSKSKIKYIAAVCKKEQDSPKGIRAEANLIANLYELRGKSEYSSIDDYVLSSGWFSGSSNVSPTNDKTAINIVDSVLNKGNRTIPLYIDEHDCWFCSSKTCSNGNQGDICSITGGSSKSYITNRKNYKKDKTVIKNPYRSVYTFYYFPDPTSDPFGYTDKSYKKVKSINK